jgi:hypothetical protein
MPCQPQLGRIRAAIWAATKAPMVLPVNMNMTRDVRQRAGA